MGRHRIKEFISLSGEQFCVLLGSDGLPTYWPNLYATAALRAAALSPSSIRGHLRAIGMASDWMAMIRENDFSEEMLFNDPLQFDEAQPLANFLKCTVKHQDFRLSIEHNLKHSRTNSNKLRRLESVRFRPKKLQSNPSQFITAESAANAIRFVAIYLEWLYSQRKQPGRIDDFDSERQIFASEGLSQLRKQAPRVRTRDNEDEALWGLKQQQLNLIESIITPKSQSNPWKSTFVRDRNYLIWRLFLETGGRREEVHKIKVSNCRITERQVAFLTSKTLQRSVPFSRTTGILIDEFIKQHWSRLPKSARRLDLLITSEDGTSLTLRSINKIFEQLRKSHPDIPDWLTPHTLRRSWNELLSNFIDALPEGERWSDQQETQVRARLMGWTPNSQMPSVYLRRHTRRKADEIVEAMFETATAASNPRQERNVANDDSN